MGWPSSNLEDKCSKGHDGFETEEIKSLFFLSYCISSNLLRYLALSLKFININIILKIKTLDVDSHFAETYK